VRQRQPVTLPLNADRHEAEAVPVVERPVQELQLGLRGRQTEEGERGAQVGEAPAAHSMT
jgi:hypothetical protein